MDLFSPKPSPAEPVALSVTQLLRRMKNLIEVQIGEVWIEGEVSNLKKQGSGHWYFSLKDGGAQIQCAMFGARRKEGAEALEDGAKVKVFAEASVYEARGQLQVIVKKAARAGLGDLQARFEALKRKLQEEGLFEASRKKPFPPFPHTIGLVTSATGAALQDMLQVLGRRAPWVQPVLFPVRVQGRGAEREIAAAIERAGRPETFGDPRCDVLIVGRGGGSLEDLWCFNEEIVARAIAACPLPVISAVGHEIDFTIADFVADLRAPTPSAAAELAVADGAELTQRLARARGTLDRRWNERLERWRLALELLQRSALGRDGERLLREPEQRVDALRERLSQLAVRSLEKRAQAVREAGQAHRSQHPLKVVARRAEHLAGERERLERALAVAVGGRSEKLARLRDLVRALGPESAFQRGFSIALDEEGRVIRAASAVRPGEVFRTRFADGEVRSRATEE